MKQILESILNIIYPQICGICGKMNKNALSNRCQKKIEEEFIFKIDSYEKDINKNFLEHYYFFKYKDLIRRQILDIKFREKPYISQTIAYFLKNIQKSFEKLEKYDIIIVVPISKERQRERGYNQSELIAKKISIMINVPIKKDILYKTQNTVPQSTLNREQRIENSKGVYMVKKCQNIKNKKILLIDDIYTTGSTLNECAKALRQKGMSKENIGVLTLAKD